MVCIVGKWGGLDSSKDTGSIHMDFQSAISLTRGSTALIHYACIVKIISNVGISSCHIHQSTPKRYLLSCCKYFFQDSRYWLCVGIRRFAAAVLRYAFLACLRCSGTIYFYHPGMHAAHCPRKAKTSTTMPSLTGTLWLWPQEYPALSHYLHYCSTT